MSKKITHTTPKAHESLEMNVPTVEGTPVDRIIAIMHPTNAESEPGDSEKVHTSGLVEKIGADAGEHFTLVSSIPRKHLASILEHGYALGQMPEITYMQNFMVMVPDTLPQAEKLNTQLLQYRHRGGNIKLILQFPFEFPDLNEVAAGTATLFAPLDDNPEEWGYAEEVDDTGRYVIPPRYIAGYLDLETGEAVYQPNRAELEPQVPKKILSSLTTGALRLFGRK